jgi:hypothetical protein
VPHAIKVLYKRFNKGCEIETCHTASKPCSRESARDLEQSLPDTSNTSLYEETAWRTLSTFNDAGNDRRSLLPNTAHSPAAACKSCALRLMPWRTRRQLRAQSRPSEVAMRGGTGRLQRCHAPAVQRLGRGQPRVAANIAHCTAMARQGCRGICSHRSTR